MTENIINFLYLIQSKKFEKARKQINPETIEISPAEELTFSLTMQTSSNFFRQFLAATDGIVICLVTSTIVDPSAADCDVCSITSSRCLGQ